MKRGFLIEPQLPRQIVDQFLDQFVSAFPGQFLQLLDDLFLALYIRGRKQLIVV